MDEIGPMEREVRKRLAKAAAQGESWDKARAAGRTGNGGESAADTDLKEVLIGMIDALTALDDIVIRLAAEIDQLRSQNDAP
jgi:hypothetical protein